MKYIPLSQRKSNTPHGDIDSIMENIARVESGGKYDAKGPTVEKGQYAGEQALGKYQIMPGNIPSWSKEALGYEVSTEEFLNDPEIQDKIARDRMSKIYTEYGNPEDVASVWFTGRPQSESANLSDVTGTTGQEYVSRVTGTQPKKMAYTPLSQRI